MPLGMLKFNVSAVSFSFQNLWNKCTKYAFDKYLNFKPFQHKMHYITFLQILQLRTFIFLQCGFLRHLNDKENMNGELYSKIKIEYLYRSCLRIPAENITEDISLWYSNTYVIIVTIMSAYLTLNLRNKFLQYQIVICLMIYCRIPIYITDGYNVLLKYLTDVQLKNIAKLLIKA